MRTIVSNEVAVRQVKSADGKKIVSIIKSGSYFRFVEDSDLTATETNGLPSYEYFSETYRSGLYVTLEEAECEARVVTPWLIRSLR